MVIWSWYVFNNIASWVWVLGYMNVSVVEDDVIFQGSNPLTPLITECGLLHSSVSVAWLTSVS